MRFFKKFFKNDLPFFLAAPSFIWQILFFCLPIIFIFLFSFWDVDNNYFTLQFYKQFLHATYLDIIFKSFLMALFNATICVLVAYPVAYYIALKIGKLKYFFIFLLIIPFWTNFLLHIYSWFFILERGGFLNDFLLYLGLISEPLEFLNSLFAICLVMFYCYLPFAVIPIYSILEKFDKRYIEASLDLGATNWQAFKTVTLPITFEGAKSAFFLVFIPSFGEFAIPDLLGGSKFAFVGTVISQYLLGLPTISYGAAFTAVSVLFLICSAILIYTVFKKFEGK